MSSKDIELTVTHNPRVISAGLAPTAEDEMRAAGVTEYGIRTMAPKTRHLAIMLENVSRLHANLIKQHILSLGGEAAVHKHVPTEQVETTHLLLSGTELQLRRLAGKLKAQPFGLPATAEMILATVANYGRNSWLLRCGSRRLEVGPPPVIMGIINVTPDSFSDGGRFLDAARAAEHGLAMIEAGATILDIGGESARPGAAEVSPEEEIARSEPVVAALRKQCQAVLSIDTRKVQVARAALAAGADMINDITALGDPAMAALAAEARCPVVLMHMQGTPQTMQSNPVYDHLVADVCRHLRRALGRAVEAGIDIEQTIVDPGIGFGKTVAHNLSLLGRLKELRSMGRPLLVGASRKSFIGKILGPGVDNRLTGSLAACLWTRAQGAAIFRVHDVAETAAALQMAAAMESAQDGC